MERDAQTASKSLIPQHAHRFQKMHRRFTSPSHVESILFEQSHPFSSGQRLYSHVDLFRHGRLNLMAQAVRNIIGRETQLVDSITSRGGKKADGLGEYPALLLLTLHAQHRFTIDYIHAGTRQSRFFSMTQYEMGVRSRQLPSKMFDCRRLTLHPPIGQRMLLQSHLGREAESWSELNYAIFRSDCQRIKHASREFKPAWPQYALTSTCQHPMSLHFVGMLSFSYQSATSD